MIENMSLPVFTSVYSHFGEEDRMFMCRIWQDSGIIKVPEQIEGIPVIRIAPYTFSLHKDEEEKNASVYQTETDEEDDRFAQPEELCCGGMVREIHLPSTVQSIGNYAFYGCMNLKLFHGTDAIVRPAFPWWRQDLQAILHLHRSMWQI